MADVNGCVVNKLLAATWPFNGVELARGCRGQLEAHTHTPYKVETVLFHSDYSYHSKVVPFSACKEGAVLGNQKDAQECAESLTRISGYSHSVKVVREARFFSAGAYQLMALSDPKMLVMCSPTVP